ncbi:DUF3275 family protein [Pseudomonas aeruginosa]|uniref:DUF3275 family protein n=1 Tax=Pseudomonas aeruginosa TaxID=287 RepID=UPI00399BC3BF
MKSWERSQRQRRPSPPERPNPPSPHPCRHPRTRWSIPRPFGVDAPTPAAAAATGSAEDGDAALFGILWPLGESVRLDSTIDRRTLRAQVARLGQLGYKHQYQTQEWSRQAALEPA